ncbi:ACP S-malonyltransferase [Bacillota bacterium LX-D]|nr:ACP S-malonyltransferase [Bacillota bacterium LX-D]
MPKIAFLFPGQGSQYIGMCQDLEKNYKIVKQVFETANETLGQDLKRLCFEGPEEDLKKTVNTQPALVTASVACLQVLKAEGISPQFVAGHSLGEYSALVAAGCISFADTVNLVRCRGELMENAFPQGQGGMAAIIGLKAQDVEEVCRNASAYGLVQPANYNAPGQTVISGEKEAIKQALILAQTAGAKKTVELAVSGPFHSELMGGAAVKFAEVLKKVTIKDPQIPIVANTNAQLLSGSEEILTALVKQLSAPVRWVETIEKLHSCGVDTFVEVGAGKVLSGLVKKIVSGVTITNVQDMDSLQKTLSLLKGA